MQIIKPLLNEKPFESTTYRYRSLFQPIQKTSKKESDLRSFILTPILDYTFCEIRFAFEVSIHLLNAAATGLNLINLWTLKQQKATSSASFDKEGELFVHSLLGVASAVVALICNTLLSMLALVTRPIASLIEVLFPSEATIPCGPALRT